MFVMLKKPGLPPDVVQRWPGTVQRQPLIEGRSQHDAVDDGDGAHGAHPWRSPDLTDRGQPKLLEITKATSAPSPTMSTSRVSGWT